MSRVNIKDDARPAFVMNDVKGADFFACERNMERTCRLLR
jgi:hypothetical protein